MSNIDTIPKDTSDTNLARKSKNRKKKKKSKDQEEPASEASKHDLEFQRFCSDFSKVSRAGIKVKMGQTKDNARETADLSDSNHFGTKVVMSAKGLGGSMLIDSLDSDPTLN